MFRNLRVGFDREPENNHVRIYMWDGNDLIVPTLNGEERIPVKPGTRPPHPSLVMHTALFDGLLRCGTPAMGAVEALQGHLTDCRSVRDRLLAMVEKRVG